MGVSWSTTHQQAYASVDDLRRPLQASEMGLLYMNGSSPLRYINGKLVKWDLIYGEANTEKACTEVLKQHAFSAGYWSLQLPTFRDSRRLPEFAEWKTKDGRWQPWTKCTAVAVKPVDDPPPHPPPSSGHKDKDKA